MSYQTNFCFGVKPFLNFQHIFTMCLSNAQLQVSCSAFLQFFNKNLHGRKLNNFCQMYRIFCTFSYSLLKFFRTTFTPGLYRWLGKAEKNMVSKALISELCIPFLFHWLSDILQLQRKKSQKSILLCTLISPLFCFFHDRSPLKDSVIIKCFL